MLYLGYAYVYAYNLAWGGLKNGKNGGDPYGYFYVFVLLILKFVSKSSCVPLRLFLFFREIFLLFRLSLFTVHVRPVLSPCQAGINIIFHKYNISHIMHI